MKTTLIYSSMLMLGTVSLSTSAEDFSWGDITFQPKAYVGYADYSLKSNNFNFNFISPNRTNVSKPIGFFLSATDLSEISDIQFSGVIGGVGGTVSTEHFSASFYYQSTLDETAYSSENDSINHYYGDGNAIHSDWAMSAGYIISEHWSVFAGYKSGKTEWDQALSKPTQSGEIKISGNFDQNGPFMGISYYFPIGPGALNFKAAYAYLDGTEKMMIDNTSVNTLLQHKLEGNSNAFSLGVSWRQSLSDNLGITVDANYHKYKFDLSSAGYQGGFENGEEVNANITGGSITENLFTFTAALIYTF